MAKSEATLIIKIKQAGKKVLDSISSKIKALGPIAKAMSAALAVAFVASFKAFSEFEKGLIGVCKTANLSGAELRDLGEQIKKLSTVLPNSTSELLEIAQAAGQLGVKGSDNIIKFTETMAKLASASDVTGDTGSKAIARILTVTGEGIGVVDRFSAALVDLGNNAAASESEILATATRVAGNVARFDASSAAILGISTALKALGKQSEASGSVVGRAFNAIDIAIRNGGEHLKRLSEVTGIAGDQLAKTFKEDSPAVFSAFIKGLGEAEKAGQSSTKIMREFDLQGVRINDVLGTLAKNHDVLATNINRSSKAWQENTAANEEARRANQSLSAQFKMVLNRANNIAIALGEQLAPAFRFLVEEIKMLMGNSSGLQDNFNALIGTFRFGIKVFLGVKAVFEELGGIIGATAASIVQFASGNFKESLNIIKDQTSQIGKASSDAATRINDLDKKFAEAKRQRLEEQKAFEIENEKKKQEQLTTALNDGIEQRIALEGQQKIAKEEQAILDKELAIQKQEEELAFIGASEDEKIDLRNQKRDKELRGVLTNKEKLALLDKKSDALEIAKKKKKDEVLLAQRVGHLSTIATLESSQNKTLAGIGKAASAVNKAIAIKEIAIATPVAVAKAYAAFPPPFNFAAAAGVGIAMAAQAANLAGVQLAEGGIVQATPGGIQATIGEGGRDEAVIPLDDAGAGGIGSTVNIVVNGGLLGDEASAKEFAEAVDKELFKLRQGNESVAFDEGVS